MYGWTNEAGEPIMDGFAYRFEQALDEQYGYESAQERMDDALHYEPELLDPAVCTHDGNLDKIDDNTAHCIDCDSPVPHDWSPTPDRFWILSGDRVLFDGKTGMVLTATYAERGTGSEIVVRWADGTTTSHDATELKRT